MAHIHDDIDPDSPKSSYRVACRALVLTALCCRASIEDHVDELDALSLQHRTLEWLTRTGLWSEVDPAEESILRAPLGQLSAIQVIALGWYMEGVAILAWCLHLFSFPYHDQQVDPFKVAEALYFLHEDAEALVRSAILRSQEQLNACNELCYAVHVRLRDFSRHHNRKDFANWIEASWPEHLGLNANDLIVKGDLAIDAQPIWAITNDRLQECQMIAMERQRAITWVLKEHPSYAQTPADT